MRGKVSLTETTAKIHYIRKSLGMEDMEEVVPGSATSLEEYGMSYDSLLDSLGFFLDEDNTRGIYLQCPGVTVIPYVRRSIFELLGYPDRIMGNSLRYYGKTITICSVSNPKALYGITCPVFYISEDNKANRERLFYLDITEDKDPYDIIELWVSMGMYPVDIVKALVRDGYSQVSAMSYMIKGVSAVTNGGAISD